MNQVLSYLYIGNWSDASNIELLKSNNIKYVVNVMHYELNIDYKINDIQYSYYPIEDEGPENDILKISKPIHRKINKWKKNGNILIHCVAGVSRSASVIIYHLMKSFHISFLEAYTRLKSIRPIIDPNTKFKDYLKNI